MLMFPFAVLYAQQRSISGRVTDENSESLPGVNVVVKGSNTGTITDADGNFQIAVPEGHKVLQFSFIGFENKEADISTTSYVSLQLEQSNVGINEVVAVGYATQKKVNLTGAVQSVNVSDVDSRSFTQSEMALQGKVPGLTVTQNSGQPGSDGAEIRIRGVSSIANNNEPLVIIDGVESELRDVNPKDIESISVLKDASSAAIYGNRAAAGVILVTTKNGKMGAAKISYTGTYSMQRSTRMPDVINDPILYSTLMNESRANVGLKPSVTEAQMKLWQEGTDPAYQPVDWFKEYFNKSGLMHNHYMSLTGATEKFDYAVSSGFYDQQGIVYASSADKFDYRAKFNAYVWNKKLKIGALISGYESTSKEVASTETVLGRVMQNRPILFAKSTTSESTLYSGGAPYHAVHENGGGNTNNRGSRTITFNASLNPVKGLVMDGSYTMRKNSNRSVDYVPTYKTAGNALDGNGSTKQSSLSQNASWLDFTKVNLLARYDLSINKNHNIGVLGGWESIETINSGQWASIKDLKTNKPILSFGDVNTLTAGDSGSELASMGYFGRLTYNYKQKYLLEGNMRYDGSSRFMAGKQWSLSPSVSGAWRISEEAFFAENVKGVENLKLRASYGILGNANLNSVYAFADELGSSAYYSYGGAVVNGTAITRLANKDVSWETLEQFDLGVDIDFLSAFSVSVDYFHKKTNDMLTQTYIPLSMGTGTGGRPYQNMGSMVNKGIEVSASYMKSFNNGLSMNVNGGIAYMTNKVLDIGDNEFINHTSDGLIRSEVGQPFQSIYTYICDGVYQISDFTWQGNSDPAIAHADRKYVLKADLPTPSIYKNVAPGDIKLRNVDDSDNVIDAKDIVRVGNARPEIIYSLSLSLHYKGLYLNMLGQGVARSQAYLTDANFYNTAFTGQLLTSYIDRWTFENQSTTKTRLHADKERRVVQSTYDLHSGAFFRMRNLELGYNLPNTVIDKLHLGGTRIFLTAENLFTISKYPDGFDPERNTTNNVQTSYPQLKTYALGISVNL